LYMDNLFTSFARYNDLNKKKETAVGLWGQTERHTTGRRTQEN
jgi:hypothetical protein